MSAETEALLQETIAATLNCGPLKFSGSGDALYERHLTFDQVIGRAEVEPRIGAFRGGLYVEISRRVTPPGAGPLGPRLSYGRTAPPLPQAKTS